MALGRPACQSSTYYNFTAGLAVDGNSDPDFDTNTCAHTQKEVNAWWSVDLGQVMFVKYITVTNRNELRKLCTSQ